MKNKFFGLLIFCIFQMHHSLAQLPVQNYFKVTNTYDIIKSTEFDFNTVPKDSLARYNKAAKTYLKTLAISENLKIASTYLYLINLNLRLDLHDTTLVYLYKILQLPNIENSKIAIGLHWNIFRIYQKTENYSGMLEELNKLKFLEKKYSYKDLNTDKIKAGILQRAGYYNEAKVAYKNLILEESKTSDPVILAVIINDLACVYEKIGGKDSVNYYREKALKAINSSRKSQFGISYKDYLSNYIILQQLFFDKNFNKQSLALAKNFLEDALDHYTDEPNTAVFTYEFLSHYYFYSKDYQKALIMIDKALVLGKDKIYLNKLQVLYFFKIRILDVSNQFNEAEQTLQEFTIKKDNVNNRNRNFDLIKYDVNQLKEENKLSNEFAIQSQTKFKNTLQILILIIVILIAAVVAIRIIILKNGEIKVAQKEIVQKLKEKEILLKELNHRVKNNLGLIISLVEFQANDLDNAAYQTKFTHLVNRINAIAIAHEQFLYNTDELLDQGYDLKNYISNIANGLISISFRNVKMSFDIENCNLNIDTAMPIGIMINELVSNSIEHAITTSTLNITMALKQVENELTIIYQDNGKKFISPENKKSLGLEIIESMVEQLMGTITRDKTTYYISLKVKNTSL
jgi:two-component sensor histidine kinase